MGLYNLSATRNGQHFQILDTLEFADMEGKGALNMQQLIGIYYLEQWYAARRFG